MLSLFFWNATVDGKPVVFDSATGTLLVGGQPVDLGETSAGGAGELDRRDRDVLEPLAALFLAEDIEARRRELSAGQQEAG